jgi:hypothetical protein
MRGGVRRSTPPVPGPEASDPAGLRQQTITLFEAFVRACEEQPAERRHDAFVAQLQAANLLKVPPTPDYFSPSMLSPRLFAASGGCVDRHNVERKISLSFGACQTSLCCGMQLHRHGRVPVLHVKRGSGFST